MNVARNLDVRDLIGRMQILHDENHYTTAHDMALIGSAVYQFDKFREVTQTLNYTIPPTNLVNESRTFQQNHKMLWVGAHYSYDYCTGGKTGYTDQAKTTLVTMADNADMQLVAVVLEDQGDVYVDTRAMFDYVYANFSKVFLNELGSLLQMKSAPLDVLFR